MSLQQIINTAQTIEINRGALVASSISRNGRLLTAARSWTKPWSFTVVPRPIWAFREFRNNIETIFNADRFREQVIRLGYDNTAWMVAYEGVMTNANLANTVVNATLGNSITFSCSDSFLSGTVLFRPGDIVQFDGLGTDGRAYRYPYVVKYDVIAPGAIGVSAPISALDIYVNRGMLLQSGFNPVGKTLKVGTSCTWVVKVTQLPNMRYLPGKNVEFTGDFKLIESIV